MKLQRVELEELMKICDNFGVDAVTIARKECGGIGYTLDAIIDTEVKGVKCTLMVNVTDVDKW